MDPTPYFSRRRTGVWTGRKKPGAKEQSPWIPVSIAARIRKLDEMLKLVNEHLFEQNALTQRHEAKLDILVERVNSIESVRHGNDREINNLKLRLERNMQIAVVALDGIRKILREYRQTAGVLPSDFVPPEDAARGNFKGTNLAEIPLKKDILVLKQTLTQMEENCVNAFNNLAETVKTEFEALAELTRVSNSNELSASDDEAYL